MRRHFELWAKEQCPTLKDFEWIPSEQRYADVLTQHSFEAFKGGWKSRHNAGITLGIS